MPTFRAPLSAAPSSNAAASLDAAVDSLVGSPRPPAVIADYRILPARAAEFRPFPPALDPRLRAALERRGIAQLYTHQADAIIHALAGRHVVIVTPTASGKTLCYNAPVLHTILNDPSARALYLFPTKALAQDQLAELKRLTELLFDEAGPIGVNTYDGDTPQDARRSIRTRAHVVLSNPDMLHAGILPHHPRWAKLFENLRFVVLDELHAYRGVFGSHLANILRRLDRICRHYGSNPTFVCSSATIANPRELAERLTGRSSELVDRSGAAQGEKHFVVVNPPVVNAALGIRRSYLGEAHRIALEFLRRRLQIIVFAQSRLATEILTTYLKDSSSDLAGGAEGVRGYRGGYLPLRRREIERGLRDGTVRGVISTNALELGIDIGALDVSVLAGYPGTIAATWQRAGRAGRRAERSAAVLVASSAPLDQFIAHNPAYLFDRSPEQALINPDNLHILLDHVKCAAFELPFAAGERFGAADVTTMLDVLAEEGFVHPSDGYWHWVHDSYPANAVSLRSISSDNFVVVDRSDETTVIAEVDFSSGPATLHEHAIYIMEGALYHVDRFDFDRRKAYVSQVDCDYYTDAITYTKVSVLETFETDAGALPAPGPRAPMPPHASAAPGAQPLAPRSHGEVHVVSRVVGFKKIRFYTNENVGAGELDLPDQQMHTTAYWLTIPRSLLSRLPYSMADRRDGLTGLGAAMRTVGQLLLMCDRHDIGLAIHGEDPSSAAFSDAIGSAEAATEEPRVFIYDNYPGGIGFSEPLFNLHDVLLAKTRALIAGCGCHLGCPSCVGPIGETGPMAKTVALVILDALSLVSTSSARGAPSFGSISADAVHGALPSQPHEA